MKPKLITTLIAFALFIQSTTAQNGTLSPYQQLARNILKELIETNTTHASGNTTLAAEVIATHLKAAGFNESDIQVVGPSAINKNLVVRLRSTNKKRLILFLDHLDVVEAKREDWSFEPFIFREEDSYFYGRGAKMNELV